MELLVLVLEEEPGAFLRDVAAQSFLNQEA
jgi:hypothetical protein